VHNISDIGVSFGTDDEQHFKSVAVLDDGDIDFSGTLVGVKKI
jgi:hypothetical protein